MITLERAQELVADVTKLAMKVGFSASMTTEVKEDEENIYVWVRCNNLKWRIRFPKKFQINDKRQEGKDFSTDEGRFYYGLCEALGSLGEEINDGREQP